MCIRDRSEAVPAPIALRDQAGEEERIRRALAAAGGNKSQAARLLGIDRKTVSYTHLDVYKRQTLKGVMEKEDSSNPEFVVPAKLKELYEAKDFGP